MNYLPPVGDLECHHGYLCAASPIRKATRVATGVTRVVGKKERKRGSDFKVGKEERVGVDTI